MLTGPSIYYDNGVEYFVKLKILWLE